MCNEGTPRVVMVPHADILRSNMCFGYRLGGFRLWKELTTLLVRIDRRGGH